MIKVDDVLRDAHIHDVIEGEFYIGLRVKSRRRMCELFAMEYAKDTHARDRDEKVWSRFFEWRKEGNAYVITKMYETPLPVPFDSRDLFSKNILAALSVIDGPRTMSKAQLYKICGFVNSNWGDTALLAKYAETNNCTLKQAKFYYGVLQNDVSGYCGPLLDNALSRISERGFLSVRKILMLKLRAGNDRPADFRETSAYELALSQLREKTGRNLVKESEWNLLNKHLRDVLDNPNFERTYDAYELSEIDNNLIGFFCEKNRLTWEASKKETNARTVDTLCRRVPKRVSDSIYNYAVKEYGEEEVMTGAVTVSLKKSAEEQQRDRIDLINLFVKIGTATPA